MTPYQSTIPVGRDSFVQLLRAEWTKFRTVRGWVIGSVVAGVFMVGLGLLTSAGSRSTYSKGPGAPDIVGHPYVPIGPNGEPVVDSFAFLHRPLVGDGSITVRLDSLTGGQLSRDPAAPAVVTPGDVEPWAKAGLILKVGTGQGSPYAAIMATGSHGVRMQYDYVGDIAGPAFSGAPQWLRLTRAGDTVTGYASTDGTTWTAVGTATLTGLAATVQGGVFATSPFYEVTTQQVGGGGKVVGGPTLATGTFDPPQLVGNWSGDTWTGDAIGSDGQPVDRFVGFEQSPDRLTVTGSGDIAPDTGGGGMAIERILIGAFASVTVFVIIAVLFVTTEYRRGLIRTTFAASPRRGRVLAAKAVVIGAVTFVVALVTVAITIPVSKRLLESNGFFVYPTTGPTEVRIIAGTAAVVALTAVFALAIGTILRRSAAAVAAVVVVVVLPYILATAGVLPAGPSQWLLRLTPAAAFAIQQSITQYPQVGTAYIPAFGFYPLGPWAGLAVLCGYTAVGLGLATYLVRRRDA
jgi:ABC-type transport system involved in multi-copper enzyme maturation permease subunit